MTLKTHLETYVVSICAEALLPKLGLQTMSELVGQYCKNNYKAQFRKACFRCLLHPGNALDYEIHLGSHGKVHEPMRLGQRNHKHMNLIQEHHKHINVHREIYVACGV